MPIHIIKDDEAATRKSLRDNIRGTIGWGALLIGIIVLSWNFTPVEMADYLRGIYRDIVDIVSGWMEKRI